MKKKKKSILKSKWIWIFIILIIILAVIFKISNTKSLTTKEPPLSNTTVKIEESSKESSQTEQKNSSQTFNFSEAEVNKDNVIKSIEGILENTEITSVDVNIETNSKSIDVYTFIETNTDSKNLISMATSNSINIYEILFKNLDVSKVNVFTSTKMKDEKFEPIFNCSLSRKSASNINWSNLKNTAINDYTKLFNIADKSFIDSNIIKEIK